jgi:putative phosphoribosyl transferase
MQGVEFLDRRDAGRRLAVALAALAGERPIVVALPRGGVPVAFEVARALRAPLDILAVRKLGAPGNPEFAVGALAEDGTQVVNTAVTRRIGMTQEALDATVEREVAELRRRVARYRGGREPIDVRGRTVIVVDDGMATGLTDLAAVRALRARGAARIVVAVPVGPAESVALLGEVADEVICQMIPRELVGVGRWYEDFSPVSDEEVLALLAQAAEEDPGRSGPDTGGEGDPDGSGPGGGGRREPGPGDLGGSREPSGPARPALARELTLDVDGVVLAGDLRVPAAARGLVIFAHGSGSSRLSPRNRAVARTLGEAGLGTVLFDLLTEHEADRRELVFDIALLARRLEAMRRWALDDRATRALPIGYFGASTGAAAALRAAAAAGDAVRAVVSRGGRPDLAADSLPLVCAATLLVVGALDTTVLALNHQAAESLACVHELIVIEGADHLFTRPGALDEVALRAAAWFEDYLPAAPPVASAG